eukprot:2530960-Rhodomonas_salina.2
MDTEIPGGARLCCQVGGAGHWKVHPNGVLREAPDQGGVTVGVYCVQRANQRLQPLSARFAL